MKTRYKLVTIITHEVKDDSGAIVQKGNLAVRVPRQLAQLQVDRGLASFTSKGRFKQMLKQQKTRERREEILTARRKAIEEARMG